MPLIPQGLPADDGGDPSNPNPTAALLAQMMTGGGGPSMAGGPPPMPPPDGGPLGGGPGAAILAQMMQGGGPGGGPPPPDQGADQNGQGMSELDVAQSIIQDLHDAMRISSNPGHVQTYATCLRAVTGLQKEMMGGPKAGAPSYGGGG